MASPRHGCSPPATPRTPTSTAPTLSAATGPIDSRRSRRRRLALVPAILALALGGCFTGDRPTLAGDDDAIDTSMTGNADIDAVLERLDSTPFADFTAEYLIETRLGQVESAATVVQAPDGRRSVTINDVRYLVEGGQESTCDLVTEECEAVINNARTSDVAVFDRFYGADFARRLRIDADRRIGDTTGYAITQGGQQALCVDVPVSGGVKSYCAVETGPLARYNGNDLFIRMTSYSPEPDEEMFGTS